MGVAESKVVVRDAEIRETRESVTVRFPSKNSRVVRSEVRIFGDVEHRGGAPYASRGSDWIYSADLRKTVRAAQATER